MFLFLEWVDAGLIAAQFSCSLPATTRLLLPNSCWLPDILLAVRSVKSARRSWLARISGCSWEQPRCDKLGPRSRAGSRLGPPDCRRGDRVKTAEFFTTRRACRGAMREQI